MNAFFKNKRVGIFAAETLPSYAGGGRHAFHLAAYLHRVGAYPTVICYNYNGKFLRNESVQGVSIRRMRYYYKNWLTKLFSSINLIRHYFIEANRSDILIIYGRYLIAYPLIVFFGKMLGKQVVYRSTLWGEDDFESLKQKASWRWPVLRIIMSRIGCFWAINNKIAGSWNSVGGSGSLLEMPQCVDEAVFAKYKVKPSHQKSLKNEKLQLLSCGILIERKGYRAVFEALSKVTVDFQYTIVGQFKPDKAHRSSKNEQEEMKGLYILGHEILGSKINFVGVAEDMTQFYSLTDIFIHASDTERPNVVLEAMAAGVPVICKKMAGVEEDVLKHNVNCQLFNNKLELVELVNSIPQSKSDLSEIADNAAELIAERFSFEKLLFKLAECLKQERK